MNMPRFTAEASLYKTSKAYKPTAVMTQSLDKQTIVPQQNPLQCWTDTDCYGVVQMCEDHCYLVDGTRWDSGWYVCGACFGFDW
jgi:hypothetical protein